MVIICSSMYELSLYADNESSSLSSSICRCHCPDHLSLLACATLTSLYVGQALARDADPQLSISDVPEPEVDVGKPRDVDVTAHFNMSISDDNRRKQSHGERENGAVYSD